jgi:hypothetical protein
MAHRNFVTPGTQAMPHTIAHIAQFLFLAGIIAVCFGVFGLIGAALTGMAPILSLGMVVVGLMGIMVGDCVSSVCEW